MINTKQLIVLISLTTIMCSCDFFSKKEEAEVDIDPKKYFEGEINLTETRGIYGILFESNTSFTISKNRMKREQRLGGINKVFDSYAGVIVDLEKDSVTIYYVDLVKKMFNQSTIKEFKKYLASKSTPNRQLSPLDNTFTYLLPYKAINTVNDSMKVKGFMCDYARYVDEDAIVQQEVFDSKEIKVKRELLELVFPNLPKETNFPLRSDFKTMISSVSNDSLVNNKTVEMVDKLVRALLHQVDSTKGNNPTDLDKLADNKWLNMGLDVLKKGIDLKFHISNKTSGFSVGNIGLPLFSLPSAAFEEVDDIDEFFSSLPAEGDFDD